eukprot:SAG11_NODE_20962_length_434_cov_4.576119_1_plen_47_part_10
MIWGGCVRTPQITTTLFGMVINTLFIQRMIIMVYDTLVSIIILRLTR